MWLWYKKKCLCALDLLLHSCECENRFITVSFGQVSKRAWLSLWILNVSVSRKSSLCLYYYEQCLLWLQVPPTGHQKKDVFITHATQSLYSSDMNTLKAVEAPNPIQISFCFILSLPMFLAVLHCRTKQMWTEEKIWTLVSSDFGFTLPLCSFLFAFSLSVVPFPFFTFTWRSQWTNISFSREKAVRLLLSVSYLSIQLSYF